MRTALAIVTVATLATAARADELTDLQQRFTERTGATLVFERAELPAGTWYDAMPALAARRRVQAARILVDEAARYPDGWLGAIGLKQVGVFDALVNQAGDGFRPYDEGRQGYLYYGLWNGRDAIAAAYYTDGQLPLTFHHEVFHHVDGASGFDEDDERFAEALEGDDRYAALAIRAGDVALLQARGGEVLERAVGSYAAKGAGEDQAETARWLMANLAAGLWQATVRAELPGSQRILHVIAQYAEAGGPDARWLVDVALGRDGKRGRAAFATAVDVGVRVIEERIAPDGAFVVWGRATTTGGNPTLREDVARFVHVGVQLGALAGTLSATGADQHAAAARLTALLDRYRDFIAARWSISAGTELAFADAKAKVDGALGVVRTNRYLAKVDAEIAAGPWRDAIRAVQPATVKIGGGSGVNLRADGLVLTAGHVVDRVGAKLTVRFPDGREFAGVCTQFDDDLDLGLVALTGARNLPVARIANAAPRRGDDVVVIGQPGTRTPDGEATGYQPWHVSVGTLRGFRAGDKRGEQHLGRAKHDAWTYWGHSGSPLFDRAGRIVALHNSWDAQTAMRHAVTWEAIVQFLDGAR